MLIDIKFGEPQVLPKIGCCESAYGSVLGLYDGSGLCPTYKIWMGEAEVAVRPVLHWFTHAEVRLGSNIVG